ncbi:MAG: hypothetical protein LUG12_02380 [Erysipelotrichaceae bacterium]|nr:hypothetical protein [Erysipelotrichaceae bacterium]
MKDKCMITICLILCLMMMLFPWFHYNGINVTGLIMFQDPIALTCIILSFIGIWGHFGMNSPILGHIGLIGLFVMEIYEFMSWHVLTVTGHYSLFWSINASYPTFYMALFITFITNIIYHVYLTK